MFWTYRYLRKRLNNKVMDFELEHLRDASSELLFNHAQGARWRRLPDGTWQRWSYLGNDWEKSEAPATLLQAANEKLAVSEWTAGPEGSWHPYDPDAKPEQGTSDDEQPAEAKTDQAPPTKAGRPAGEQAALPPSRLDPDFVPRPEWTSDWKPGWNQDLKS